MSARDATAAEIGEVLRSGSRLVVTTHVNPDGDAVGSALAALHATRAMGTEARYVQVGPISSSFAFLPGFDEIAAAPAGLEPPPEVLLALDCASEDRLGTILEELPSETTVLNIDHHVTNTRFGDLALVDPSASSTGEILHRVLEALGAPIGPETATCLYVAIVTDTGRFGYGSTRPETHLLAADLLRAGVRPEAVHGPLFREQPLGLLRLTARIVEGIGLRRGGRIAWAELTHAMCEEAGVLMKDSTDMVDVPASVAGVEVAALFRETPTAGETKVSLRSKGAIPVNDIAVRHGGGGHPAAAGCTVKADLATARDRILSEVEEAVDRAE